MPRTTPDGAPTEPPPSTDHEHRLEHESLAAPERFRGQTEAELLGLMSRQNSEPEVARDAWDELYRRHVRYLYTLIAKAHVGQLDDTDISDVVADTFQAAYRWCGRQGPSGEVTEQFAEPDHDRVRRRVLGWLSVIARRNAGRLVIARERHHEHLCEKNSACADEAEPPPPASTAMASAMGKLTRDELEVLLVSLPWYDAESRQFLVPRGEASRIARGLDTTVDALRQRRLRSLRRLRTLLESEANR